MNFVSRRITAQVSCDDKRSGSVSRSTKLSLLPNTVFFYAADQRTIYSIENQVKVSESVVAWLSFDKNFKQLKGDLEA